MLPAGLDIGPIASGNGNLIVLAAGVTYVLLNLAAFIEFYADKHRAVQGRRRTPERTLLLLSLLGPFGAYAAMKFFHHKTHKLKFQLVPMFALAHIVLAALIFL